jgi:uncharacterized YigZ family protein
MVQNHTTRFMTVNSASLPDEFKVKGSRFIGQVFHIESKPEFEASYRQFQKNYVKATHYCYAYRLTPNLYHCYDDGEPGGTAGKPIYHVLAEQNLYQVLLIVARYFGGTKLGRNGLIRAYTQSAQETLQKAEIIPRVFYMTFKFQLPYVSVQDLTYLVKKYEGVISQTDYLDQIKMQVKIPEDKSADFTAELNLLAKKKQLIFELTAI